MIALCRTVLVIEDDPLSMELMSELLGSAGWTVRVAASAEEGLLRARQSMPTLVLMDIGLPGLDGLAATRELRADPRAAGVKIVALTAQAMAGDAERGIAAGFDDYLTKPIDTRTLLARLDAIVGKPTD